MNDKQNYLPVSTLSNLSKVFNKITYSQIYIYIYIYIYVIQGKNRQHINKNISATAFIIYIL